VRTVLLVDDDDEVRETAADMLMDIGYRVLLAESGTEALNLLECGGIDIMVSDIRMPGMSGIELARHASSRYKVKIILMSAYFSAQPIAHPFLAKPFRVKDLDAAIRAEIGA
jgi:CheY-like chemotaxis protein